MKILLKFHRLKSDIKSSMIGATAIEYALIAALIAGGIAGGIGALADLVTLLFDTINSDVADVATTP